VVAASGQRVKAKRLLSLPKVEELDERRVQSGSRGEFDDRASKASARVQHNHRLATAKVGGDHVSDGDRLSAAG
jgi:hypothetical protein